MGYSPWDCKQSDMTKQLSTQRMEFCADNNKYKNQTESGLIAPPAAVNQEDSIPCGVSLWFTWLVRVRVAGSERVTGSQMNYKYL